MNLLTALVLVGLAGKMCLRAAIYSIANLVTASAAQQSEVLRGPEQHVVPQNENATFTCSTRGELLWEVITIEFTLNDTATMRFLQTQSVLLANTTRNGGLESSTLIVNASPISRNETKVGCGVTELGITHRIDFFFFGRFTTL